MPRVWPEGNGNMFGCFPSSSAKVLNSMSLELSLCGEAAFQLWSEVSVVGDVK